MSQINNTPPLEPEVEGVFVEEEEVEEEEVHSTETMNNKGKGLSDDKEEYLKLIKHLFDYITNNMTYNILKGFELMAIQLGSKGVIGDSSSSQSEEKKTMGGHFFTSIDPMNFR